MRFVLFLFLLLVSETANAQVRVRKARNKFDDKRDRMVRAKDEEEQPKRKTHSKVTARIKATTSPEGRNSMDALLYVKWQIGKQLQYTDFTYNKNIYNKLIQPQDTDLTKTIYPDYREFYKKLNERINPSNLNEDSLWKARVEKVLREKPGKNAVNLRSANELGEPLAITVDSPAASVINILPVIYAKAENVYYYNITALFSRYDSWMIVKSRDILEHEQIHFDIFELYARKMRKYLVEVIQNNYMAGTTNEITDDIAPVFEQLYKQLNDLQLEFDRQTAALTAKNAALTNTNTVWKKGIAQQLAELEQYALPEATITLN
jgi:hypothetical protein